MAVTLVKNITARAVEAIRSKLFPGCVVGVVYRSGERIVLPFGNLTYSDGAALVRKDTIYDVASITKSIPTASLALQYIDQNTLKLTDRLITYVPEFKNADRDLIKIKHLLTYTLGGYRLSAHKDKTPEELRHIIMTSDFKVKPGTGFFYSNITAYLLGLVVERIGGRTLDSLAYETFFEPIHMRRTAFFTDSFLSDDIAPTEIDYRGEVRGVAHDESAYVLTEIGKKAVGHAGLFSTAPDLLNFLEMLLHEGDYHGHRYFSPEIIQQMSTNQIPELNATTGLGWQLNDPSFMGQRKSECTFGKTGFTGTSVVCDIKREVAFTILSNRTYPKRALNSEAINAFRNDIADIVFASE